MPLFEYESTLPLEPDVSPDLIAALPNTIAQVLEAIRLNNVSATEEAVTFSSGIFLFGVRSSLFSTIIQGAVQVKKQALPPLVTYRMTFHLTRLVIVATIGTILIGLGMAASRAPLVLMLTLPLVWLGGVGGSVILSILRLRVILKRCLFLPQDKPVDNLPPNLVRWHLLTAKHKPIGPALWLQWILVNSMGWTIVMMLFSIVRNRDGLIGIIVSGIVVGAMFGVIQWMSLRWWIYRCGLWVLVSAIGGTVGLVVGSRLDGIAGFMILGLSVGVVQWLLLRRWIYRASWWVLANAVGGAAGGVVGMVMSSSIQLVKLAIGGVVFGVITGGPLVWLLKGATSRGTSQ